MTHYLLPPEWAPQSGVMLTWPHAQSDWAPWLADAEATFLAITKQIARFEKVLISCFDDQQSKLLSTKLQQENIPLSAIQLHVASSDDTWARDHGPITVLDNNKPLLLDFKFNAWGGKYAASRDDQLNRVLQQQGAFGQTPLKSVPLILEGGSIEVDGQGTLLTTANCLLAESRNKDLSRTDLEAKLHTLLGVKRVLWLENGLLEGDDTDSHIDTLARFADPHTICYMNCDDPKDSHYASLQAMAKELAAFKDYQGHAYKLVPLPWPKPIKNKAGKRLPATYANFLIINNAVLVPTYNDPADNKALAQLQPCFPDREIIGIPCQTLIEQFGSLHCVTMQLPIGVLP